MNESIQRLYRSRDDRMLFGVCGGLGEYLRVDPTLIRLIVVALIFMTGPGVFIAYFIFALVVPEAPLTEQT